MLAQEGLYQVNDLLPHYARPDTWLTAIRVLFCFISPLIVGSLIGHFDHAFGIALASGMTAVTDPRGSSERRSVTILGATFGGVIFLTIGHLVAGNILGVFALCLFLGFSMGMVNNFGMAAVRAGYFWITSSFMGSTSVGIEPLINQYDILAGGIWALMMALTFFKTPSWQRKTLATRLRDCRHNFLLDLTMRTPIGRMAYRIMISAGIAVVLVYLLGRSHAEWAAAAAIALYFPLSPVLYKRGARFIIATILAIIVCFIFITSTKSLFAQAIFVGATLFISTAMRETNYAAFAFTNTIFYVLVIMMASGVGGVPLLTARLTNVALGLGVALLVALLTLPARERLALLVEMDLPLPAAESIDDPVFARIQAHQLIEKMYHPHSAGNTLCEPWMQGFDVHKEGSFLPRISTMGPLQALADLRLFYSHETDEYDETLAHADAEDDL